MFRAFRGTECWMSGNNFCDFLPVLQRQLLPKMKQSGLIHNVIITNENGTILLSAYWDGSSPSDRGKFEHDLYFQSRPEWVEIKPRPHQDKSISPLADASPMPELEEAENEVVDEFKTHVSLVDDKCVVYKKTSDVVFFITGSGEYSELILNEILDVIINGMMAMCPKKRLNAKEFGVDNSYGKMVAMLDQIIYMGHYCQSDIVVADARAKMKAV